MWYHCWPLQVTSLRSDGSAVETDRQTDRQTDAQTDSERVLVLHIRRYKSPLVPWLVNKTAEGSINITILRVTTELSNVCWR